MTDVLGNRIELPPSHAHGNLVICEMCRGVRLEPAGAFATVTVKHTVP